jgi:hypothetical protein
MFPSWIQGGVSCNHIELREEIQDRAGVGRSKGKWQKRAIKALRIVSNLNFLQHNLRYAIARFWQASKEEMTERVTPAGKAKEDRFF